MVSPVKQIWKDFSTGKGGNAVSFLMEHEHYSYPEAIKFLAKKYNIEIEETAQSDQEKEQMNERESMFLVSNFAKDYFHDVLLNATQGKAIGLSYFKERGFREDIIKKFDLTHSLIILDKISKDKVEKSMRNIPNVKVTDVNHFSAFDIIKFKKVVFTESSIKELEKRYS